MKRNILNGFTLVELIIVITILAILSTIGFLSFQSYSKNSRDSNRLSTLNVIEKGLSLNQVKTSKTLLPDDNTQVLARGSLMGYEGIVGENVSRVIELNGIPKDPLTQENYIYYTNKDRNKVELMGFVEGDTTAYLPINRANAAGTGSKIPKVLGERLGILLDVNNNRVTGTSIDILLANSGATYSTYFSNLENITGSGKDLFSNIYNRRSDLLSDKGLASLDDSLVGYWDMETLSGGKLKDFSKNRNDGILYGGMVVGGANGIKSKATYFDGVDDFFDIGNVGINFSTGFTFSFWAQTAPNSGYYRVILSKGPKDTGHFEIGSWTDGKFYFYSNDIGTPVFSSIDDNILRMISLTYSSGSMTYYINGNKVSKISATGSIFSEVERFYIGRQTNTNEMYFKGVLDELSLYNRILSDAEISELYNSKK